MKPSDLVLDQLIQQIFAAVMCEADLGSAPGGPAGASERNQSGSGSADPDPDPPQRGGPVQQPPQGDKARDGLVIQLIMTRSGLGTRTRTRNRTKTKARTRTRTGPSISDLLSGVSALISITANSASRTEGARFRLEPATFYRRKP